MGFLANFCRFVAFCGGVSSIARVVKLVDTADLKYAAVLRYPTDCPKNSIKADGLLMGLPRRAHAQMQTTSIYRRRVAGRSAKPVMRKIR